MVVICNNETPINEISTANVPNVIGTKEPISDNIAKQFSPYFFSGLATEELSVGDAFEQTSNNILLKGGDKPTPRIGKGTGGSIIVRGSGSPSYPMCNSHGNTWGTCKWKGYIGREYSLP